MTMVIRSNTHNIVTNDNATNDNNNDSNHHNTTTNDNDNNNDDDDDDNDNDNDNDNNPRLVPARHAAGRRRLHVAGRPSEDCPRGAASHQQSLSDPFMLLYV